MTSATKWMKFYPSDWLAGSRGLTPAECGIYITLICLMYEKGAPVPRDDSRLARQCGLPRAGFRAILDKLIEQRKVTETDDGLWNDRVAVEHVRAIENSSTARRNARARWSEKDNKNKEDNSASALQSHSNGNADQDQNITPKGPMGQNPSIDLSGMSREIRDYARMGINRDAALAVLCQHCGVGAGGACVGNQGQTRQAPHIERYQLVAKLREGPTKAETASLPIVREGDPLVPFLAKVRGKEIIFGTRGTVTATPTEMAAAKAMAGAA